MDPPLHQDSGSTSRVAFTCDLAQARAAAKTLRAFLAEHGADEHEQFACELCLTEACTNAVRHVAAAARGQPCLAEATCTVSTIELRVTDHTTGFDLPPDLVTPPLDRENGRGVFIIRSMMDGVRYLRNASGNTLVMWKQRAHHFQRAIGPASSDTPDQLRRQLEDFKRTIGEMARELCFRSESLAAIFRCGTELGRAGDLDGFARRLLGDLMHLASADWYVLRLIPPQDLQLKVFAASSPELLAPPLRIGAAGTTHKAAASSELVAAATRAAVPFSARQLRTPDEPLRTTGPKASGLVHPVLFGETLVGTLAVGRHDSLLPFTDLQVEVIRTFAEFIAIQIVNLRHQEAQAGAKVMKRELEIARSIQQASFPRTLPQFGNFSLAGRWESARQVAGDFYDALPLGERSLMLVVADVMGKGVPAAMFATITRALIRALAAQHHRPAELLKRLNELLYEELSAVDMFVTVQLVCIDLQWRHVVVASAGHCPAFVVPGDGRPLRNIGPTGTPLGILPHPHYDQECTTLEEPACLLMHTDGVTEAINGRGEMFGRERLADWLGRAVRFPCTAEQLCEGLSAELGAFRGDAALRDDQTFLVFAEKAGSPERPRLTAGPPPRVVHQPPQPVPSA